MVRTCVVHPRISQYLPHDSELHYVRHYWTNVVYPLRTTDNQREVLGELDLTGLPAQFIVGMWVWKEIIQHIDRGT